MKKFFLIFSFILMLNNLSCEEGSGPRGENSNSEDEYTEDYLRSKNKS